MSNVKQRTKAVPKDDGGDLSLSDDGGATTTAPVVQQKAVELTPERQREEKRKVWRVRTKYTFIMIFAFLAIIYVGHWACVALVAALEALVWREMENVRAQAFTGARKSSSKISWSLFFVANGWVMGRVFMRALPGEFDFWGKYHTIVFFLGYCFVFIFFVLSLKKGFYKVQFVQFAWCHMILITVLLQANFWISNIFAGLFWFLLPASLVITNDCMAFVFGSLFGRHPLISISPKKTWEGWLGGTVCTIAWAWFASGFLSQYQWLVCPKTDLSSWDVQCTPMSIFATGDVRYHVMVLALFASIIAPFGGFFASGLKRAFKLKDFDAIIPGHGGMTDRFDCQFLNGTFTAIYLSTFIIVTPALPSIMAKITKLDTSLQLQLFTQLQQLLTAKGAL